MKVFSSRLLAFAALATLASAAHATLWTFSSMLMGTNEVPPNASPATGTATGTYDDISNMFMMDVAASGFIAPVTAAHVHVAPAGTNGGVLFPLTGATGSTSYSSHDMATLSAGEETDFLAGNFYVNIHTSAFPGGEIRGQLEPTAVPEPATFVGMLAALGIFVAARRKR